MRDRFHIIPFLNAGILHAIIAASLLFAFDWGRTEMAVPLAIKGQVISGEDFADPERIPLEVPEPAEPDEPEPLPEPEPEPEPEEELPPQPDPAEQARLAAEEARRQEDLRAEQERIAAEEAKRQEDLRRERERIEREEEAERQRQAKADAERKRREDQEAERRREEAERRRLEEIERQRQENERRRREAEEQRQRQIELQAEQNRIDAENAGELERYVFALRQKIERNWVKPATAGPGLNCTVSVRQSPSGDVLTVEVQSCNGDDSVRRSIEAAVQKASPLPLPSNPALFERNLRFLFEPTQ